MMRRVLVVMASAVLLVPAPLFFAGQAWASLSEERELPIYYPDGHISPEEGGLGESGQTGEVEIFVTSWCPYCRQLENLLKKNNIAYTRHDVEKDQAAEELFSRLGGQGVPLVRVGSTVIHGYDPQAILAAAKDRD